MSNVITDPKEVQWASIILIDHEGQNLGIKSTTEAINIADEIGMNLVVVNDKGDTPICRIMDAKKQEYKKKIADRKSKTKTIKIKEVRVNAGISEHDLKTKTKSVDAFLKEGHHVKITIRSRDRRDETQNIQYMMDYFNLFIGKLSEPHKVDGKSNIAKNQYTLKIVPQ